MLEKTALPQNNAPKRRDIQGLRLIFGNVRKFKDFQSLGNYSGTNVSFLPEIFPEWLHRSGYV